ADARARADPQVLGSGQAALFPNPVFRPRKLTYYDAFVSQSANLMGRRGRRAKLIYEPPCRRMVMTRNRQPPRETKALGSATERAGPKRNDGLIASEDLGNVGLIRGLSWTDHLNTDMRPRDSTSDERRVPNGGGKCRSARRPNGRCPRIVPIRSK